MSTRKDKKNPQQPISIYYGVQLEELMQQALERYRTWKVRSNEIIEDLAKELNKITGKEPDNVQRINGEEVFTYNFTNNNEQLKINKEFQNGIPREMFSLKTSNFTGVVRIERVDPNTGALVPNCFDVLHYKNGQIDMIFTPGDDTYKSRVKGLEGMLEAARQRANAMTQQTSAVAPQQLQTNPNKEQGVGDENAKPRPMNSQTIQSLPETPVRNAQTSAITNTGANADHGKMSTVRGKKGQERGDKGMFTVQEQSPHMANHRGKKNVNEQQAMVTHSPEKGTVNHTASTLKKEHNKQKHHAKEGAKQTGQGDEQTFTVQENTALKAGNAHMREVGKPTLLEGELSAKEAVLRQSGGRLHGPNTGQKDTAKDKSSEDILRGLKKDAPERLNKALESLLDTVKNVDTTRLNNAPLPAVREQVELTLLVDPTKGKMKDHFVSSKVAAQSQQETIEPHQAMLHTAKEKDAGEKGALTKEQAEEQLKNAAENLKRGFNKLNQNIDKAVKNGQAKAEKAAKSAAMKKELWKAATELKNAVDNVNNDLRSHGNKEGLELPPPPTKKGPGQGM